MLIKYFTKGLLIEANNDAHRRGRNKKLNKAALATLPDLNFPITFSSDHNDGKELRVAVSLVIDSEGKNLQTVLLDIDYRVYKILPSFECDE